MTEQMPLERNQSQIRRLLDTIDLEYQAASLGLTGIALGTSMHEFITARMERIEVAREQLVELVGVEHAAELVVKQLTQSASKEDKPDE